LKHYARSVGAAVTPGSQTGPFSSGGRAAVRTLRLANGLKVIVWPDHAIPGIALYNWVRVGSRNETEGATGLAHFFEHMMFNGTARHPAGEFDRLLEERGGSNNAFTSEDVTVYQSWFPRDALDTVLHLEADRMVHLAFDPQVVESERGVVYSERLTSVDDNAAASLSEQMQAQAFSTHPYRFPTIGLAADIRAWTVRDLRAFYRTYYAPNNQTFVLAGDIAAQEAFELAQRHLAPVPRQAPPPRVRVREPLQRREHRVVLRRPGQSALLQYAYKAPAAADARGPALDLLLTALVDGNASRLYRALVEQRGIAIDVAGDWRQGFDPSLCWLYFTLAEGVDAHAAHAVIDAELARVAERGLSEVELRRARHVTEAGFWKQLSTLDGKAQLLGEYELLHGDWRHLFEQPARCAAVTRDEVARLARALLDPRRRTVGMSIPQGPGA